LYFGGWPSGNSGKNIVITVTQFKRSSENVRKCYKYWLCSYLDNFFSGYTPRSLSIKACVCTVIIWTLEHSKA
jgi:hypothetical protein